MKCAICIALFAVASFASAQTPPDHRFNCASVTCTFVSDPFPLPVKPAQCRLYGALNGGGEVPILTSGVVAGTAVDPTAPAGSVSCWLVTKLAPGTWVMTATALDASGQESPHSLPYIMDSVLAAPPAPLLHIRAGTPIVP